jgi:N-acyl-D-amino-acid deacylase
MQRHDLLISGASVIDGTGAPARRADVAVLGERIAAVGDLAGASAERTIDASGLALAPGFIDAHTHDDRALLDTPDLHPKISQGVTTVITGNCGISLAPFAGGEPIAPLNLLGGADWFRFETVAAYLDAVRAARPAVNVAPLAGHTALRARAMPALDRAASGEEIARMSGWLEEALDAGCIGLSTGLAYPPAQAASTDEVVALAERVGARGGIYTTHMRDERTGVVDSIEETLEVGRRARVPVVISHHKCSGREAWGLSRRTLERIAQARRHQRVDLDVYPYTASSTVLLADWVPEAERVTVTWSVPHPEVAGRDLEAIAREWGLDLGETCERLQPAGAIYFQMDERDLRRILAFEDAMVGSDGLPHDVHPHPRLWGTFPRVLGHYVREEGLISLEEAVHKMSGVTARVFGLEDRGIIAAGAFADLVLLDPASVTDRADFDTPTRPAAGIREVLVNGQTVWDGRAWTGAGPGRVLRRAGM